MVTGSCSAGRSYHSGTAGESSCTSGKKRCRLNFAANTGEGCCCKRHMGSNLVGQQRIVVGHQRTATVEHQHVAVVGLPVGQLLRGHYHLPSWRGLPDERFLNRLRRPYQWPWCS